MFTPEIFIGIRYVFVMAGKQTAKTLNLDRGTQRYIRDVQKYPYLDVATERECAFAKRALSRPRL